MKMRFVFDFASSAALLLLTTLSAPTANAGIFNVNTTVDLPDDGFGITTCHTSANNCSLRAAIMKANQVEGSSVIYVPAGTYTLTIPPTGSNGDNSGDLNITNSIAIVGQGAGRTIIDGNQIDRVLDVAPGQFFSLTDLTIRNGFKQGANGAGIRNAGIATIIGCVIEDNHTNADGVNGNGAGIYSTGSLDILRSTIRSNRIQGSGEGGGIDVFLSSAVIRESTIAGNVARDGGGIFAISANPYLYIVNSTISGNAAYNNGGGILSAAGGLVGLYSTSVIGNDASSDGDGIGQGGGVYAVAGGSTRFIIVNTLIANNTINNRNAFNDCNGRVEAYGFNLFSLAVTPGCDIVGDGSAAWGGISVAGLGSLQDNGGPTLTHALLQNSEAINGTTSQGCIDQNGTQLTFDQRGAPRVAGFRCDVGAYEFGSVIDRIFKNGFD
jgi:hypothetical protein